MERSSGSFQISSTAVETEFLSNTIYIYIYMYIFNKDLKGTAIRFQNGHVLISAYNMYLRYISMHDQATLSALKRLKIVVSLSHCHYHNGPSNTR